MAKGNVAANHRPALAGATLPGYVIERNTRAVAAGLRIEKQSAAKFKLSTVYGGSPEAFVKSGFVKDEKGFFSDVRRPTKHLQNIWRFMGHPRSPIMGDLHMGLYRTDGPELRLTITRELLPRRQWVAGRGVTAFEVMTDHAGLAQVYTAATLQA